MNQNNPVFPVIPVIDVFAGPGGLSEGFSAYQNDASSHPFKVVLSMEKEATAHKTLRLRAFLRWFIYENGWQNPPQVYIDYVTARNDERRESPALFLGTLLHEDAQLEERLMKAPFEEHPCLLAESYGEKWRIFSEEAYPADICAILEAADFARKEARRVTLGKVDDEEVLEMVSRAVSEESWKLGEKPFILIGGPPCQAYSGAGRSRRANGIVRNHTNEDGAWDQDSDERSWLYKEYMKILAHGKPAMFVMENVRGMLSAKMTTAEGTKEEAWKHIVRDLQSPMAALSKNNTDSADADKYVICSLEDLSFHYDGSKESFETICRNPTKFLVKAVSHGIPQDRERVILLGIRRDLISNQEVFSAVIHKVNGLGGMARRNVADAIYDLPRLFSSLSSEFNGNPKPKKIPKDIDNRAEWRRKLTSQLERLIETMDRMPLGDASCTESDLFNGQSAYVSCMSFYDRVASLLSDALDFIERNELPTKASRRDSNGKQWLTEVFDYNDDLLKGWYQKYWDENIVLNHDARGHMDTDLGRYAYSSAYAHVRELINDRTKRVQATLEEYQKVGDVGLIDLMPQHKNKESNVDRFKTQRANHPAKTVTSHISKDGHYFIHPDPAQCRSLTVREAARLQTFPDNYFFEGNRTQQYVQVGNAVPPLLAKQIAETVYALWEQLFAVRQDGGDLGARMLAG